MRAMLSADRKTVEMKGNLWSSSIPVASLPDQIAMYRHFTTRMGGKFARHHQPTLDALLRVQKRLTEARGA